VWRGPHQPFVEAEGARQVDQAASATAPPRGMIESPKTVTISDPPRSGR